MSAEQQLDTHYHHVPLTSIRSDSPEMSSSTAAAPSGGSMSPLSYHHPGGASFHGLAGKFHVNATTSKQDQPPHYSSLIGKTLPLDKLHHVLVEEVIAEGGFGVIFLVKNTNDKAKYALKRVVVNNDRDYAGVVGEVAIMASLSPKTSHILSSLSHVIVLYGSPGSNNSSSGSVTYEVQNLMPLCKHNLHQVATSRIQKSSSFTETEILQILKSTCSGLQFLHSCTPSPIIHRDIKIENILVADDNSTYVLSDFGSATTRVWDPNLDHVQAITEDLDKHTTLQYRSPEMVDLYGNRGPISVASDIWALGVTGYKLMTFKDPFESILAIQNRNLNWGSSKGKYSEQMVLVVECLLAENQATRPHVDEVIRICAGGLSSGSGSAGQQPDPWTPLNAAFQRIQSDIRAKQEEAANKKSSTASSNANVVMETTVTPRQRPKRNPAAATVTPVVTAGVIGGTGPGGGIPPVLAAPPKSPKPVSPSAGMGGSGTATDASGATGSLFSTPAAAPSSTPQQRTISPTTLQQAGPPPPVKTATPSPIFFNDSGTSQQQTPQSVTPAPVQQPLPSTIPPPPSASCSWNPFDEDYDPTLCQQQQQPVPPPPPQFCDSDSIQQQQPAARAASDDDDDPFARAPFDYFKYQPIMMMTGGADNPYSTTENENQHQYVPQFPNHAHLYYAPNNPFLNYPENEGMRPDPYYNASILHNHHQQHSVTDSINHFHSNNQQVINTSNNINILHNNNVMSNSTTTGAAAGSAAAAAATEIMVSRGVTNLSFDDEYLGGTGRPGGK